MRLSNSSEFEVSRSDDFQSCKFDIKDVTTILKILRSRIYTNPLRTMIQEIISNARDANIEAGTPDVAVQVFTPDGECNDLVISDNGIGITPQRMNEVYVNYGSSSKRNSDVETGGFGLGAKSPFAYTDMYNIETVSVESDGVKRKRLYCAFIDETQNGDLNCVTVDDSSEPTGTKVRIPIQPEDFGKLKDHIRGICKYWSVVPVVNGEAIRPFNKESILKETDEYYLFKNNYYGSSKSTAVLVDGIPYDVNTTRMLSGESRETICDKYNIPESSYNTICKIYKADSGFRACLKLKNFDVELSPSREDLIYSEKTKKRLFEFFLKIYEDITGEIKAEIEKCPTYVEAVKYFHLTLNESLKNAFKEQTEWNGIPVQKYIPINVGIVTIKDYEFSDKGYLRFDKERKSIDCFSAKSFFINDMVGTKITDKIHYLLNEQLAVNIIEPTMICTNPLTGTTVTSVPNSLYQPWLDSSMKFFNALGIRKISEIVIPPSELKKATRSRPTLDVFKGNSIRCNVTVQEERPVYVIKCNKSYMINGKAFPESEMEDICKFVMRRYGIKNVYIVKQSISKKTIEDNWTNLDEYVKRTISEISNAPKVHLFISNMLVYNRFSEIRHRDLLQKADDPKLRFAGSLISNVNQRQLQRLQGFLNRFDSMILEDSNLVVHSDYLERQYPMFAYLGWNSSDHIKQESAGLKYLNDIYEQSKKTNSVKSKYSKRRQQYV